MADDNIGRPPVYRRVSNPGPTIEAHFNAYDLNAAGEVVPVRRLYVAVDALLDDTLCDSLAEVTGSSIENGSFKSVLRAAIELASTGKDA